MVKKITLFCIAILVSILPIKALETGHQTDNSLDIILKAIVDNSNDYSDKVDNLLIKNDKKKEPAKKDQVDPNTTKALEQYFQLARQELLRQAAANAEANKKANSRYSVDQNSDLSNKSVYVTTEDMNNIIRHFDPSGTSPFQGQGNVFIEASKESGLDPIYIFAHASWESDYGRSYLARDRGNYFGINAIDANPNAAHHMGNTMYDGIVNGAVWISKNYYQEGQTSLNSMIYGGKRYAKAADKWIKGVNGIMAESYAYLKQSRGM
jgi:gp97